MPGWVRRFVSPVAALVLAYAAAAQDAPIVAPVVRRADAVHFFPERSATAAAIARYESKLGAEIAARIAALPVEVGQVVAKGAVVAQLDDADAKLGVEQAQAALGAARARLALSEQQLARARDLHAKQFISVDALAARETETAVVRSEVATAESALRLAERTLAKTIVRAPFSGVVTARPGQVGELAQPGAPLVELKDAATPEVSSPIPTAEVAGFDAKQAFVFESQGNSHPVRLLRLSPTVTAPARTREARLAFIKGAPPAGTEGRLRWKDMRPHLPAELIVQRSHNGAPQLGVFVVEDNRAKFVPIAGAQPGRPAPSPLAASAMVVVAGQAALTDRQAIANSATAAGAASAPQPATTR
ncbi:MAG TPA: efflux RND transporter periplasmic adaptor subunit [Burkholderiaceae bacterium]|nr:efflux RND transporter periplasmic adaptor subunit [Burkholderiaceae bacterium]